MVCILLRMFPTLMQNCQMSMYGIAPGFAYKGRRPGQDKREGEKDMTPKEVLQFAQENGAKMVDLKFVDLPGSWQHFSIPVRELREETFVEGVPFDGSSIRGFQTINESDMLVIPDATAAIMDPFTSAPTLSLICNIAHPGPFGAKKPYSRDPRYIASKAEEYLRSSGIADTSYFGPEAEFYIFDDVRYNSTDNIQYAEIDSHEAHWNSSRNGTPNLGHRMRVKEGYFPVAPNDTLQDIRSEMALLLEELGVPVEAQHHEVGAAGQAEIDIRFNTLLRTADNVMLYKYITKNTARKHGKTVTFMPKPVFGDNGSGMHTHQSLWQDEKPLFYDGEGYAGLSQIARYYIGGLLTHAPALLAIVASTTNSYKRLVPGFEAPINLVFSKGNRSAAVRVPLTDCPSAKRIEFRPPDPTANPYLDHLSKEEQHEIRSVPGSLDEVLDVLEDDHSFLLEGGVFTTDLLEHYVELKRAQIDEVRLRPVPIEFALYYDA